MMNNTNRVKIRIVAKVPIGGHAPGTEVLIPGTNGFPDELYWRKRLADGSAELVATAAPKIAASQPAASRAARSSKPSKE